MTFLNVYNDPARAFAYAQLEFPGTYYLAFRDLPELIARHVVGNKALDFGCGAGRSTRFLSRLGFEALGIDISGSMIDMAQASDPLGHYRQVMDGDFRCVSKSPWDLVLSAFAFDNISGERRRIDLLSGIRQLLAPAGRLVLLGSTPDIYTHEWASFTTAGFPENERAGSGEMVRIVMKDVTDARPVIDFLWSDADYRRQFEAAGLDVIDEHRPLGRSGDDQPWITETVLAPWVIYVLQSASPQGDRRRETDDKDQAPRSNLD